MSEWINNREYRQEKLKEVIQELHEGKTVDEVKEKFGKIIEGVSPVEIGQMEVQLVKEGLPIEEIQKLCDVHAAVFKGSLDEIHHPEQVPGHPIYTLKKENEALESYIENTLKVNIEKFKEDDSKDNILKIREDFNFLWDIDKHYSRKENLIFPYLEKYGVTAPPKVMWGVDDEIRAKIKTVILDLRNYMGDKDELILKMEDCIHQIKEMIFKEDSILFPMSLETLTEDEWITIYKESEEVGFAFVSPEKTWEYKRIKSQQDQEKEIQTETKDISGTIKFENGSLTPEEIRSIFEVIPGEVSFVDKNDKVKFFSKGEQRIFTRTKAVIGREVSNCHPPSSVDMVDKIVDDFKSGKKDSEDFWIQMGEKFVLIRFFAVRNEEGEYLGTLEYVQNVAPIRNLEGEKRLISE
ncbi:DUF438 domain-containing protein [Tissierella creatinophila]|uniref:Hemerythrin HHE cation binding domain protein n=1 Tax=Tissierella creatinophila DSM 6911 TaxID=1123403 RepID=A0A1U7M5P7_TISCR|nr:DUF438 domain-containing protein [Tissierella creatinophila]OLS02642.1 hypothetical protein TICRE_14430 [Tissierella creatinophila DSM 6911]